MLINNRLINGDSYISVPVLVNAIKELSYSIDSLNSRLEVSENNS